MVDAASRQRNSLVPLARFRSSVCLAVREIACAELCCSDVKPHNFVITGTAHIRLIDFGSAAPLLPAAPDGSQIVPSEHCLVPCGTCDYISPEILQAHEEALVALEMDDDEASARKHKPTGYGRETDWWSMGAMLYEMAYGVAPFFSREIRHTYARIMDHHVSTHPVAQNVYDMTDVDRGASSLMLRPHCLLSYKISYVGKILTRRPA